MAAPPILALAAAMAVAAAALWLRTRGEAPVTVDGQQPASLKTAFTFAALYVMVLLAVAMRERPLRRAGLYAVSAISGLTDVDAITLSVARLVGSARSRRTRARASSWWACSRTSRSRAPWRPCSATAACARSSRSCSACQLAVGAVLLVIW